MIPEKKCMPLSFNERSMIWSALRYRKEEIIKSPFAKRDKKYVKSMNELLKKFK